MIPQHDTIFTDDLQVVNMPSLTYKINYENNRIEGITDGIDSVKQAIDIMLETPRYSEKIFPNWYGHELYSLIGQDRYYIESEAERMIKDTLLTDDRIKEIKDFVILDGDEKDEVIIRFTAVTIFGETEVEKKVKM